jgi:hypothetical protein
LYGRAGRLNTKNGGFRPGQSLQNVGKKLQDSIAKVIERQIEPVYL